MLPALLTHTSLALLLAGAPSTPPAASVEIPRWSSYEMTLTATGHYESPFVSVDLVGVFTGPNNVGVVVRGFWDGGQTFRIRFTPTLEGAWTFTTVSDDPGLDGHAGSITCTKPAAGAHGFVRQAGDRAGRWTHDDGGAVGVEATPVSVRARPTPCDRRGDACADPVGSIGQAIDLPRLQAADRVVADALASGRLAQIVLFDAGDAAVVDGSRMYQYVEYMAARYGAFPNVIWCLHPAAAGNSGSLFWSTAGNLLQTLDPYFVQGSQLRVLRGECAPAS
jgi:hypothetical protein